MAHSLAVAGGLPDGSFLHALSGTQFTTQTAGDVIVQTLSRPGETEKVRADYIIGSGSHAFGLLVKIGDHLFQSPLSYYTGRHRWDMAPGYEQSTNPDFSRPVTIECLTCHSDRPMPVASTLNSYRDPVFVQMGIQCDRCHGDPERHLHNPVPGSIINPSRLPAAARDSICEQCHLAGEVRIPNAGKSIADFRPGDTLEDVYTVYVVRQPPEKTIRVISHSEQLALSMCARSSGGRLWCGTCHNPHEIPANPAAYFRQRCLTCHAATLAKAHAAPDQNCIACHMPRRPAKDGGHTAFTDHRISRHPETEPAPVSGGELAAWREPDPSNRNRNLAMALISAGLDHRNSDEVIRGYRLLNRMAGNLSGDAAALTTLGNVVLKGKQPIEAARHFARALELRPDYAPYEVNLAIALLDAGNTDEAARHLERAVRLDPLLQQAVELLSRAYTMQNEKAKADAVMSRYRTAMGITVKQGS